MLCSYGYKFNEINEKRDVCHLILFIKLRISFLFYSFRIFCENISKIFLSSGFKAQCAFGMPGKDFKKMLRLKELLFLT